MKLISRKNWISALFLAALALAGAPNVWALTATVTGIQGEVSVARKDAPSQWQTVTTDTPLETGDIVKTGTGSCTLTYPNDQATFAVDAGSQITLTDESQTFDLRLMAGNIHAKVNHAAATKPFQVITPAAVAAIRGTEVDFGYNDKGEFAVDLHNGKIQVINESAQMTLDLDSGKQIKITYNKEANTILVKNECSSSGPISFNALGTAFSLNPCDENALDLATAEGSDGTPSLLNNQPDPENPDEGREPISPTKP